MARILVVEDDDSTRELLGQALVQAGHWVELAPSASQALRVAKSDFVELVLMDLLLPDGHGTDLIRALQKEPGCREARIIIVSAKGDEIDRVVGFELGADDYITKPFSIRELVLRVAAVLRRLDTPESEAASVGELEIDKAAHRAMVGGREVALTSIEFKLLSKLLERRERVHTRDALLREVWGANGKLTPRAVDTCVKRLREKLGSSGRYIETVRGIGYRVSEAAARRPD